MDNIYAKAYELIDEARQNPYLEGKDPVGLMTLEVLVNIGMTLDTLYGEFIGLKEELQDVVENDPPKECTGDGCDGCLVCVSEESAHHQD